jgi:hypothetical protein
VRKDKETYINELYENPIYKEVEFSKNVYKFAQSEKGFAIPELDELLVNIRQYHLLCMNIAEMNFELCEKLYHKMDIVKLHELQTEKLALTYTEPEPDLVKRYKQHLKVENGK